MYTSRRLLPLPFAAEMGNTFNIYSDFPKLKDWVSEAFARKAWVEGFYPFMGSRQSVMSKINCALYPKSGTGGCAGDYQGYNSNAFASTVQHKFMIVIRLAKGDPCKST